MTLGVKWGNIHNWTIWITTVYSKWEERKKFLWTCLFRRPWRFLGRDWCRLKKLTNFLQLLKSCKLSGAQRFF